MQNYSYTLVYPSSLLTLLILVLLWFNFFWFQSQVTNSDSSLAFRLFLELVPFTCCLIQSTPCHRIFANFVSLVFSQRSHSSPHSKEFLNAWAWVWLKQQNGEMFLCWNPFLHLQYSKTSYYGLLFSVIFIFTLLAKIIGFWIFLNLRQSFWHREIPPRLDHQSR